jgi:chromosome transmission fidelity protein 18
VIKSQTTTLDEKAIKSTALGLKDTSTSVTAVWDKLFKIPAKKRQKGVGQSLNGLYCLDPS